MGYAPLAVGDAAVPGLIPRYLEHHAAKEIVAARRPRPLRKPRPARGIAPAIIIFSLAQRTFVEGISVTGIKG